MWRLPLALCVLLELAELASGSGGFVGGASQGGGGGGGGGGAGGGGVGLLDDGQLEVTFSERTRADWEKVWHQESHSRCREKLIRHLYWACEKDIYRISRRSGTGADGMVEKRADRDDATNALEDRPVDAVSFPWAIDREVAYRFLRTRRTGKRRSGGSITAECCTRTGCTWEEYAEYCPSNKRLNHYRRKK